MYFQAEGRKNQEGGQSATQRAVKATKRAQATKAAERLEDVFAVVMDVVVEGCGHREPCDNGNSMPRGQGGQN